MRCSNRFCVYLSRRILSKQVRRSKTHIVVIAALATLSGCAPLATVREISPRLGAEYDKKIDLRVTPVEARMRA